MTPEGSYKKCLEEIAETRKTLTPQYQKLLDTVTELWKEMEVQLNTHPEDGNAVMAQAALSLLLCTFRIRPQSAAIMPASFAIIDTLERIAKISQVTDLLEGSVGNAESTKTLQ